MRGVALSTSACSLQRLQMTDVPSAGIVARFRLHPAIRFCVRLVSILLADWYYLAASACNVSSHRRIASAALSERGLKLVASSSVPAALDRRDTHAWVRRILPGGSFTHGWRARIGQGQITGFFAGVSACLCTDNGGV